MEHISPGMYRKDSNTSMKLYICKLVHSRIANHRAFHKTKAHTFQASDLELKTALILMLCLCLKQTNNNNNNK